ncbi:MAG TPA: HD-GYP domain-containing protein [Spirochaetia bacterium]|nr:HD-GYP domain-containing protein [Spirochaetia bacterium]
MQNNFDNPRPDSSLSDCGSVSEVFLTPDGDLSASAERLGPVSADETANPADIRLESFLRTLASAIESKDSYTGGHVLRVAHYASDIAGRLGLSARTVRTVYLGAIVHDVGKIAVSDLILNKPDKLTADEYDVMKQHTVEGHRILSCIEDVEAVATVALCHQEKWDGSGYPRGLLGEEIPIEARIVTVADVWDALTTDRPYRLAYALGDAMDTMRTERGRIFDPLILDLFLDEQESLYLRYLGCAEAVPAE